MKVTTPTPVTPVDADPSAVAERLAGARVAVDAALRRRLEDTGAAVTTDDAARADAGRDWWPVAIGWAAQGRVPARADVVVTPTTAEQVAAVLAACAAAGVPVTPVAGRSGVCGGAVPAFGGVSLDLTGLNGPVVVDEQSLVVDVPAGVFGPDLEAALRTSGSGYTLGHWPQSMQLSTVGGWLACRSAGQYSTRYGKIEDMVIGVEVALADGRIVHTEGDGPRAATGPNLTQLFVGSEGTLGVITSARLRLHPAPAQRGTAAYGYPTFGDGLDACRRILRRGATPAVLRLYDEVESERNFGKGGTCVLIVLDEADPLLLDATMAVVEQECSPELHPPGGNRSVPLDPTLVDRWLEHRNDVSALAPLWRNGIVVDTAEVSGRWGSLPRLAERVVAELEALPGTLVASVHQSHAYPDGACLYFTFAGRREGGESADLEWEEAYYRAAWDTVTRVVRQHHCAISHHHGIGLNRSRFMADALGEGFSVLAALKHALDPAGILNPGKLGLPSPFGPVGWP
jgi:alkyldihydroxyacetonephosphate synthase